MKWSLPFWAPLLTHLINRVDCYARDEPEVEFWEGRIKWILLTSHQNPFSPSYVFRQLYHGCLATLYVLTSLSLGMVVWLSSHHQRLKLFGSSHLHYILSHTPVCSGTESGRNPILQGWCIVTERYLGRSCSAHSGPFTLKLSLQRGVSIHVKALYVLWFLFWQLFGFIIISTGMKSLGMIPWRNRLESVLKIFIKD